MVAETEVVEHQGPSYCNYSLLFVGVKTYPTHHPTRINRLTAMG